MQCVRMESDRLRRQGGRSSRRCTERVERVGRNDQPGEREFVPDHFGHCFFRGGLERVSPQKKKHRSRAPGLFVLCAVSLWVGKAGGVLRFSPIESTRSISWHPCCPRRWHHPRTDRTDAAEGGVKKCGSRWERRELEPTWFGGLSRPFLLVDVVSVLRGSPAEQRLHS